jgi:Putative adhesin
MSQPDVHEFSAPAPITAVVRLGAGDLIVVADDQPSVRVTVTPHDDSEPSRTAAANTRVSMSGDRLDVEVPNTRGWGIFRHSARVRIDVRLPQESQLRAQVASAEVHTDGRLGEVKVEAASGDTFVAETSRDLSVESASGDVRVQRVGGALRVNTASGDVVADWAGGPVHVNSASGDVTIEEATAGVRASTASGDIHLGAVHGDQVKVNSASGDVTVGVPVGTSVWLDLGTLSGTTSSDLSVGSEAPSGGPKLNLQVNTLSGDIRVHRVGPSAT